MQKIAEIKKLMLPLTLQCTFLNGLVANADGLLYVHRQSLDSV